MSLMKAGAQHGSIGNYELLNEIGRGSFGAVYKARHWQSHQLVALKVMTPNLSRNASLLKRFQHECVMAARIDHPNIVRVVEYSVSPSEPFLVMELVEGISLGERLEREPKIPENEALRLIVQACQGLEQIHHHGLFHRDIKPDNILVTAEGVVKITDLGLAKDAETNIELTRTGTGLGTPNFIAPEQFRNAKNVDRRCDVYSVGATLYQLLTGVLPFNHPSPVEILMLKLKNQLVPPQKIVPWLSDRVAQAIVKSMSIDPGQRFSSCWKFVEALIDPTVGLGPDFEQQIATFDYWYVHYVDSAGAKHRATASSEALGKAFVDDRLGDVDTLRLSRTMAGPFKPLERFPELHDILSGRTPPRSKRDRDATPQAARWIDVPESTRGALAAHAAGDTPINKPTPKPGKHVNMRSTIFQTQPDKPVVQAPLAATTVTQSSTRSGLLAPGTPDLDPSVADEEDTVPWKSVLALILTAAATFIVGQYLVELFK